MKVIKEVETTSTRKVLERTICDICGSSTKGDNWAKDRYEVEEVEIRFRRGKANPELAYGQELEFDICPTCFMDKLVPWLRGQGVERPFEQYRYEYY